MSARGTLHRNATGNSYDRRRRRERIWRERSEGDWIKCHHCPRWLRKDEFEVDRFPICGHDGGRYVIGNTVPSCPACNRDRCAKVCGKGVAAVVEKRCTCSSPPEGTFGYAHEQGCAKGAA